MILTMKPLFLKKNTQAAEESFITRYAELHHTNGQYHYHAEYELLYNIQNRGTRFVGDSIDPFSDKDLVLIGPNIPHYWKSYLTNYQEEHDQLVRYACVHFFRDFAGNDLFLHPVMSSVSHLLEKAKYGVFFQGREACAVGEKVVRLAREERGWNKVLSLIFVLCKLAEMKDYRLLASPGFCNAFYKARNEEKISTIYNFLVQNHHLDLGLEDVANHAGMNPSAFCRYFKRATSKTYSEVLNEIRIGMACKSLIASDHSISQIAYECGYQNVPYFNRQFIMLKKCTPFEFRHRYRS